MKQLILGSQSRDRKRLLKNLYIPFQVIVSSYAEEKGLDMPPHRLVQYLASKKMEDLREKISLNNEIIADPIAPFVIITADTMIVFKDKIIGKAADKDHAIRLLTAFSGNTHELLTAVSVYDSESNDSVEFVDSTRVKFSDLSAAQIKGYVNNSDEWQGRAGAYSLRERASLFIEKIDGSPSNVIGLPIDKLYPVLLKFGVDLLAFQTNQLEKT